MKAYALICVLCLTTGAMAQSFHLVEEGSGEALGPFYYRQGEHVALGDKVFTLLIGRMRPPSQEQRLKQTRIPDVDFRNATVRDVVDFVRQASIDFSPWPAPNNKGINIILKVRDEDALPSVTFRATDLSLYDTLKAVSEVAGMSIRTEGNVVWVRAR